jgi:transposase InsO family protein
MHAQRERSVAPAPRKRGPCPAISDAQLLQAIERDLARSPWKGEGHRKVFGRLRILDGIRTSRTRVLRLMREHRLLSPHRGRCASTQAHDGTITTAAPDVMWGTDGVRVLTVEDGWVWIFCAVEHWNAECVGWHVCKIGNRFAALEPISMALEALYGSVDAEIARGLALRMDHGTQYLSDHFVEQIQFWGITPSFAFVEQPQTNGVAERFNRTLKEQAIHGRIFRTLHELRVAVAAFVERYNHEWRLEKLGFQTPCEARKNHRLRHVA